MKFKCISRALAVAAVALLGLLGLSAGGCGDGDPRQEEIRLAEEWPGPNYDTAEPMPADTALIIALRRTVGSEFHYEMLFTSDMKLPDGTLVSEKRKSHVEEKVLKQAKTFPDRPATNATPMDMTQITEGDEMRYKKTTYPSGVVEGDVTPVSGSVGFGPNSVSIVGFTTLPMDSRRYPVSIGMQGPNSELPFSVLTGRIHYLLPHFPPAAGASNGMFYAGGTWKTQLPVFYPVTTIDPSLLGGSRFVLYTSHTLEGYRQVPGYILARISYTYSGSFDSQDPAVHDRFPQGWSDFHVVKHTIEGEGTAIIDVGHGEILWKSEKTRFDLKEAHFLPPDPKRKDKSVDPDGKWEKFDKTITDTFIERLRFGRIVAPPKLD